MSLILFGLACSCSTQKLQIKGVNYQSVRTSFARPTEIPKDASIAVEYYFDDQGKVQPVVYNLTDGIMIIDQSKSFLVNTDGTSISYYDPNVYSSTTGDFSSSTSGMSFNLGAVTNALGIGGALGALANGATTHYGNTQGSYSSKSVTIQDQKQINIGPKGVVALGKQYNVKKVGWSGINYNNCYVDVSHNNSPIKFTISVSYSLDDGNTFEMLTTNFYVNSSISVRSNNNKVSKSINSVYAQKNDALAEYLYMFLVEDNIKLLKDVDSFYWEDMYNNTNNVFMRGYLIDYK